MVTLEDLRRVSDLTVAIVGEIFRANELATVYEKTGRGGENFIAKLYVIESHVDELKAAFSEDIADAFAIANPEPVIGVDGPEMPHASAHNGIMWLGMHIGSVAFAVMSTARPGYYSPGTEYLCPRLVPDDVLDAVAEEDMYKHVDIALAAFRESFPRDEELNRIAVMLRQELARAIKVLGQVPNKASADSGQESEDHGPISGNRFHWGDKKVYLSPIEWRIVDAMWGRDKRDMHDVIEKVWGDSEPEGILPYLSKMNKNIAKTGYPKRVSKVRRESILEWVAK